MLNCTKVVICTCYFVGVVLVYKIQSNSILEKDGDLLWASSSYVIVAIDSAGNEQNIVLETDDPDIIDISGELIAYRGPGSNEVWISKYNETESPDLITHIDLQDGVVCVMAGAEEFNSRSLPLDC